MREIAFYVWLRGAAGGIRVLLAALALARALEARGQPAPTVPTGAR